MENLFLKINPMPDSIDFEEAKWKYIDSSYKYCKDQYIKNKPSSKEWLGRKLTAIPKTAYTLFKIPVDLFSTTKGFLFYSLTKSPNKKFYLKIKTWGQIRYLQEAWGEFSTLFSNNRGRYILEKAKAHEVYYDKLHLDYFTFHFTLNCMMGLAKEDFEEMRENPEKFRSDLRKRCGLLQLKPRDDWETISKKSKKLMRKYHPDKNLGNKNCEEKYKQIHEAKEWFKKNSRWIKYGDKRLFKAVCTEIKSDSDQEDFEIDSNSSVDSYSDVD